MNWIYIIAGNGGIARVGIGTWKLERDLIAAAESVLIGSKIGSSHFFPGSSSPILTDGIIFPSALGGGNGFRC